MSTTKKSAPESIRLKDVMVTFTHGTRSWAVPASRLGLVFYSLASGSERQREAISCTTDRLMEALCRDAFPAGGPTSKDLQARGHDAAPVVPAAVSFPLAEALVWWGDDKTPHVVNGDRVVDALAYLYRRGLNWDDSNEAARIMEGLAEAAGVVADAMAAGTHPQADAPARMVAALGEAIADYSARVLACERATEQMMICRRAADPAPAAASKAVS